MKRGTLTRRTPLKRTSPLRSRPKSRVKGQAEAEWKIPHAGFCDCGCGRFALHLEHHHVLERQAIKREGRLDLEWDARNGMYLSPICHARHTSAFRRIPLSKVPLPALEFGVELLGEDRALAFFLRTYALPRREGDGWTL